MHNKSYCISFFGQFIFVQMVNWCTKLFTKQTAQKGTALFHLLLKSTLMSRRLRMYYHFDIAINKGHFSFCTCLIRLIMINLFFRYFSQQSLLCLFLILKFWILLLDICSPEDIFVGETEMFNYRLMMWTFFSCELYRLWSVEWFYWMQREHDT